MGVIFELDEYVVLKDFSFKTAISPNKNPSQKVINFKKGQRIGGYPAQQRWGMTLVVDVNNRKVYIPIKYVGTFLKRTGRRIDLTKGDSFSNKKERTMKKYCFNYSVEGVYTILPTYKCACAPNSKEAFKIVEEYANSQENPRKITIYKKPYSPQYANPVPVNSSRPSALKYAKHLDKIQTIQESCTDNYSELLGYGIFCGKRCVERKIAAGIPPLGARRASKGQEAAADAVLAQAALEKTRTQSQEWTPIQVAGVVAASLLGIALMVVIIKKAKK